MSQKPRPKVPKKAKGAKALRADEEQFRLMVEAVKDYALLMLDPDGFVASWNAGAQRIKGYKADEIIGEHFSRFYSPEDIEREHPAEILRTAAGEGRYEEEGWRVRKDGSRFWAHTVITAIRDEAGKLRGFAKVTRDVSERKENEEALRLSEERFTKAFEHAAIGIALVSPDGHWLKVNAALCHLVGYSAEELMGKTFQDITHPEDLEIDLAYVRQVLDGKINTYRMEKRYFRKDGQIVWVHLGVSLVRDKENRPLYFISQVEDITETKAAMARQIELTEKAQAAERAKSEFLAIMSHEIRTPMNGVIGMTSILADTELNEMQRDCVRTITSSGESLLAVINDILDYSKIEVGRMEMESRSFNLRECVEEALDLFATQIRLKNLEAAYLIAPDIPTLLIGDPMRLRQVLVNLIGNAVKFTLEGEIVVNVECRGRPEGDYELLFSVADTGIGIPKNGMKRLFQAFQQVDTSTTRRYGGTGLGLVISKRMTELMGGTMWVESESDRGSTFFFTVKLKAAPESAAENRPAAPAVLKSKTALIVEDSATNRRILETQLKIWGMAPVSVSCATEALKHLGARTFDVILLDHQMAEVDGITLAREIRRRSGAPIILLSSSGEVLGNDADLFQSQVSKPVKHSSLLSALLRGTGVHGVSEPDAPDKIFDQELGAKHPLRILIVEDNAVNQKVGLAILSRLGYKADLAANGLRAVEAVAQKKYDLILMDIQMPEMNGIEAATVIREKLGPEAPPMIALTAEALEGDRERFLGLGFEGYMSKPLQASVLQATLKDVKPQQG
jgi:two-component system, sensor histidine kinase and response regulator